MRCAKSSTGFLFGTGFRHGSIFVQQPDGICDITLCVGFPCVGFEAADNVQEKCRVFLAWEAPLVWAGSGVLSLENSVFMLW